MAELNLAGLDSPGVREAIDHYRNVRDAGKLDALPADVREHFGRLDAAGVIDMMTPDAPLRTLPTNDNPIPSSVTTTPTTTGLPPGQAIPGPAGEKAGIGQILGGMGLPAALSLVLAPTTFGGSLAALPLFYAAARAGGMLGEGGQGLLERLYGALPSRAGTPTERMQTAGQEAGQAELMAQAMGVPAAGLRYARSFTPTAKEGVAAATRTAAAKGAATVGPEARAMAGRTIDTANQTWRQLATQEEGGIPRTLRVRQERLQGPPPVTPAPKVSPILAPVGRGMNAEPIVTQPRAKVLRTITGRDVPAALSPGREATNLAIADAEKTIGLLKPIRDAVGDIKTIRLASRSPDAMNLLRQVAQTPQEHALLDAIGSTAEGLTAKAAPSRGITRAAMRLGSVALGAMAGAHGGGPAGGAAGAILGHYGEQAMEPIVKALLDRALNRSAGRVLRTIAPKGLAPIAGRTAAQTVRQIGGQQ